MMASLLGLAAAGIASYKLLFDRSSGAAQAEAKQRNTVAALGRIEPRSGVINLGAGIGPDRLDSLTVERGDLVGKGDVLGYLGGWAEQVAQREMVRAQVIEMKSRLKAETGLHLARVRAAELHRRRVVEVLPHRIAAQEATIASLEAKRAHEKEIQAARELLLELRQQYRIDQLDAATQIEIAHAALDRTQVEFPISSLERQLGLVEERIKRLTLHAPCDCRVLNIRVKPGEEIGSGPILSLGDTERMRAVAEVYETEIAKVRGGQAAVITSRALQKPVNGRVIRVGNMVFKNDVLNIDPAARADARVVEVWIDLDDEPMLKQLTNLTVDVLITTSPQ
jgi:HlyD family secretion protein